MAQTKSHIPLLFDSNPYYDDFSVERGFLRHLFKPGYGIQARELTQIQSILQNQIERFGSHVFENGSVVLGGEVVEGKVHWIRVSTDNPIDNDNLDDMVGQDIKSIDGGSMKGRVVHVLSGGKGPLDEGQIVFFTPSTVGSFSSGETIATVGDGNIGESFAVSSNPNVDPTGTDAIMVTVNEGFFFVDGFFVHAPIQTIVPFNTTGTAEDDDELRVFSNPTSSIGFDVTRSIVNASEDETLRDPASGFYNFNAPGSDRYKIDLTMNFKEFTGSFGDASNLTFSGDNFVELIRIVDGNTTKKIEYADYSELEDTMARRTFDESGHYTIGSPKIRVVSHGTAFSPSDDTNKFAVGIDPHKSYVSGFEIETQSPTFLSIDKPRTTQIHTLENLDLVHGNYFVMDDPGGAFDHLFQQTGPADAILNGEFHYIKDSSGNTFGSCNVVRIRKVDDEHRAYINGLDIQPEHNIGDARKLNPVHPDTGAVRTAYIYVSGSPKMSGYKSLLFPTTGNNTISEKGLGADGLQAGTRLAVQLTHVEEGVSVNSGDKLTIAPDDGLWEIADTDVIVISQNTQKIVSQSSDSNGTKIDITFDETLAGDTIAIFYSAWLDYDNNTSGGNLYRKLTRTNAHNADITASGLQEINGIEYAVFPLAYGHVTEITSVVDAVAGGGTELKSKSILDDGQRSYAYTLGRVFVPVSELQNDDSGSTTYKASITYFYYNHTGIGPVTIDSFLDAGHEYDSIPTFTDPDSGKFYQPQKFIDYRPTQHALGNYQVRHTFFGMPLDNLNERSTISYESYLPRTDSVIVGEDRSLSVATGVPGLFGEPPQTTASDMVLYHLDIEPYVFDIDRDIRVRHVDNRRFTMKQIGNMENENDHRYRSDIYEKLVSDAISRATEEPTLNDGSSDYSIFPVTEGIVVDDFTGHAFSDVANLDHNCSMDTRLGAVRPPFDTEGIQVNSYPNDALKTSSDGIITYDYTETRIVGQTGGTETTHPNPYGEVDYLGFVKLTPSSDFYFSKNKSPYVLVNTYGENNAYQVGLSAHQEGRHFGFGTVDREYFYHWLGVKDNTFQLVDIDPSSREYVSPVLNQVNRYPDRILRTVGDKTVDESVVPNMRGVGITFTADGLMPDSTVYAFFDSSSIGNSTGYAVESDGSVSGHITIDDGEFLSGEKSFRLSDRSDNDVDLSNTMAETKFYSQGLYGDSDNTARSYRELETRKRSVNSPDLIDYAYDRTQDDNYTPIYGGMEPLAQEIIVDSSRYSRGIYLTKIDLFFRAKDSVHPVTIQLRPMEAGFPHPNKVVPLSTVTVQPTNVAIDNGPNDTSETTFTFSSPVYLQPGRYAVCVLTNGSEYELYTATVGQQYLDSSGSGNADGNIHSSDSGMGIKLGSVFNPINNGARVENTNQSFMMNIHKPVFDMSSEGIINLQPITEGNYIKSHSVVVTGNQQPHGSGFMQPTTSFGSDGSVSALNSEKILSSETTIDSNTPAKIVFPTTGNTDVSPVIDIDRIGLISTHDKVLVPWTDPDDIGSDEIGELRGTAGSASNIARYVSKRMTIPDRLANDMLVCLKAFGKVRVYVKTSSGAVDFDSVQWEELYPTERSGGADSYPNPDPKPRRTIDNVLQDYYFRPSSPSVLGNFNTYSIKIVLFGGNTRTTMSYAKDLRAIPLHNELVAP
jgi:hypothetical protein